MRSDKYNQNKKKARKRPDERPRRKSDTMSEDFLAEFKNIENNQSRTYEDYGYEERPAKKVKKKKNQNISKSKTKPKKQKKRRWPKVLVILLLLVGIAVGAGYFFLDQQVNKFNHVDTANANFAIDDGAAKELKNYRNIAILGIDARQGEDPEKCRTDAIIIATINKKNGNMTLTSVMRDSYMLMDSSTGNELLDKATHAHAFGGPINTCKMLNQTLDLNIEEFIVMDWNSVADTVDAMGGITVTVKDNELRDLNKWGPETAKNTNRKWHPITKAGTQKIDGAQAATYCRIRKTSGGDQGRTDRMKKVMTALVKEAAKNPTKITKLADEVLPEIRTNMETSAFISLAPKLLSFNIDKSFGYPFNYWGGIINGSWLAVPTTLEENVIKLHEKVFDQKNYNPSNTVKKISQNIVNSTGMTQGTEAND